MSTPAADDDRLRAAADRLRSLGVRRVESYAWRDLDDPDAGGSEVHADHVLRRWVAAGIAVHHRTSTADRARSFERNGYRVTQRGGRFDVFARVAARQLVRRRSPDTATVEIWNGVPWFGPLWAPRRRVVWMHHVHEEMWDDALPGPLAPVGRWVEGGLAPRCYRRSAVATLSESSAEGIRAIGIPAERIHVIPPGVEEQFSPDPARRSPVPLAVVVGRLAPVKRQRVALAAIESARKAHPELRVELIGTGPDLGAIEAWIAEHGAAGWVTLRGRVTDDELVDVYRRAWLVVSASHAEGWGMSLTEGAACGTPAVATDISGHRGAVIDGETGVLAPADRLGAEIAALLADEPRRQRLATGALAHAATLSWTAVAARHLDLLADVVEHPAR